MPPGPGSLIIMNSFTPSSGWMRMTSRFGCGAPSAWSKIECGMLRNWMTISEARLGQALAGADVERHAGPAPVLDLGLESHEGLGARALLVLGQLVLVAGDRSAVDRAAAILAAHGAPGDIGH